jgi:hypothetical protein
MQLQRGVHRILLGLTLILSVLPAYAFERLFPPIAKRGTLSTEDYPTIAINGKIRQLSAGAWIRNENNTIDMPVTLRGRRFVVNYTENNQGEIDRVWILSPTEANAIPPNERQTNQGLIQAQ